jgi:pilus assembly protein Flp/PilA
MSREEMPMDYRWKHSPAARMLADARGATAIEYALIASGICVAIMSAVWSLGDKVMTTFYDKLALLIF